MSTSLLKLQIGPVQDFIVQARSTRDLWSGSYLLSWLMAHAILQVKRQSPRAEFIFPDCSRQPLIRFLENQRQTGDTDAQILTPNLPNVFLAVLDSEKTEAEEVTKEVEKVFDAEKGEWANIATACLKFLNIEDTPFDADQLKRWAFQIGRHWQVTWQVWPMQPKGALLKGLAEQVPMLRAAPSSADGWNENYQIVSHRLDARRQLRDFQAWEGKSGIHKDHFSGKEEAIADKAWLAVARKSDRGRGLPFLFRSDDALGAVNLIKRVWHKAYLERSKKLKRAGIAFDSVPDVAAAPWRKTMVGRLTQARTTFQMVRAFQDAVVKARHLLDSELCTKVPLASDQRADKWLHDAEQAIFNESTWAFQKGTLDAADQAQANAVLMAFEAMRKELRLRAPGHYYAVIALDGDEMGKWISGEMTAGGTTRELHREFSQKLSGFALRDARAIVEAHEGFLIFSGGDDALALLPATRSLDCVKALLDSFSQINVSGRQLTTSAGIAIGHLKAPLQDMITAALEAEKFAKRGSEWNGCEWKTEIDPWDWPQKLSAPAPADRQAAKQPPQARGFGRNAFAVILYKRSGEMVCWGAKHTPAVWNLLTYYQEHSRPSFDEAVPPPPISGRFAHRLAELLLPYGDAWLNAKNKDIVLKEAAFVTLQQTQLGREVPDPAALAVLQRRLRELCEAYLENLAARRRPVAEFLHLFTTEAFLAQQGD